MEDAKAPSAVNAAYELSLKSMDTAVKYYEAQDSNLDRVITLVVTFSAAMVAVLTKLTGTAKYDSFFFFGAVAFFTASLVVAFIGKYGGAMIIINPRKLWEEHLDQDEAEFKSDHIYYLGENFEALAKVASRKWWMCVTASALFCLEVVCLVAAVQPAFG